MPKTSLATLTAYCDRALRTAETGDYEGAVNGLQVLDQSPAVDRQELRIAKITHSKQFSRLQFPSAA